MRTDIQADMTKLIVVSRNFENALKMVAAQMRFTTLLLALVIMDRRRQAASKTDDELED
jgi:hypothetical protein